MRAGSTAFCYRMYPWPHRDYCWWRRLMANFQAATPSIEQLASRDYIIAICPTQSHHHYSVNEEIHISSRIAKRCATFYPYSLFSPKTPRMWLMMPIVMPFDSVINAMYFLVYLRAAGTACHRLPTDSTKMQKKKKRKHQHSAQAKPWQQQTKCNHKSCNAGIQLGGTFSVYFSFSLLCC